MPGRAIVTGASRGLGLEFALLLHRVGYDVVAIARTSHTHPADRWQAVSCDLSDLSATAALANRLFDPAPDVFVHCAATAPTGTDLAALTSTMTVNFSSAVLLAEAAAQGMVKRSSGAIVMVSSLAALAPIEGFAVYGASKAALDAYTAALELRLRSTGVHVLLARPGRMSTEFFAANGFADDVVERSRNFPPASEAAEAIYRRLGTSGEYVHGGDRWLVRARRFLPEAAANFVWAHLT